MRSDMGRGAGGGRLWNLGAARIGGLLARGGSRRLGWGALWVWLLGFDGTGLEILVEWWMLFFANLDSTPLL